jgi:hypothetical protein
VCLVEEAQHLASGVLSTSLLVIHNAEGGGEHDVTETTSGQNILNPLLNVL